MKTTLEEELISNLRARRGSAANGRGRRSCAPSITTHAGIAALRACGTRRHCCRCRRGGNRPGGRSRWGCSRLRGLERCADRGHGLTNVAGRPEPPGRGLLDQPAGGELGSGTGQPLLTDVRGPFTVALYQNDSAYMGCFTSSSFTQLTPVSSDGGTSNGVLKVSGSGSGSGSPSQGLSTVTVAGTTSFDRQKSAIASLHG